MGSSRGSGQSKYSKQQPTLTEWWSIWLDKYARNLKPNIREDYRGVSPAVTAKIYAHALDESKAVASAELSRRLQRVS